MYITTKKNVLSRGKCIIKTFSAANCSASQKIILESKKQFYHLESKNKKQKYQQKTDKNNRKLKFFFQKTREFLEIKVLTMQIFCLIMSLQSKLAFLHKLREMAMEKKTFLLDEILCNASKLSVEKQECILAVIRGMLLTRKILKSGPAEQR